MDEKILELYEKYESCREVAEQIGISGEAVRRTLIKHGVPRTHRHPKPLPKRACKKVEIDVEEAAKMYADGMTLMDIGNVFGCCGESVKKYLVSSGVSVRSYKKVVIDFAELKELREHGLTMVQIAAQLGTTRNVVCKRCMEYGIVYGKGHSPANKKANHSPERSINVTPPPPKSLEEREKEFIERLAGDSRTSMYEYVGGYKSRHEKVTVRCRKCGDVRESTPSDLFRKNRDKRVCFNCLRIEREQADENRKRAIDAQEAAEYAKDRVCPICGEVFHSKYALAKYCSKKCKKNGSVKRSRTNKYKKRAERYGVEYEPGITLRKVESRDGGICQLCGEPCDRNDRRYGDYGPLYPSIDHIVAMRNGGGHVWENVQLAHMICNSAKRDLENDEEIAEAVAAYAPDGGRDEERHAPGTAQGARAGDSGLHRHGRRVAQHGAARQAVPRDDTRDRRAGGRR